jgi:hypothetical protein
MNRLFKVLVVVLVFSLAAMTVYAGLHFIGGAGVSLGSVHGTFSIAGFGSRSDVTVTMTVTGDNLTAQCINRGGTAAPGQNPVDVNASTSVSGKADRNGRFSAELSLEILPSWREAGCPNRQWTVDNLIGTIFVNFYATDGTNSDTISYTCDLNEPAGYIACTEN